MVAVAGPEGRQRCSLDRPTIVEAGLGAIEDAAPGPEQVRRLEELLAVHCACVAAPQVGHRPYDRRA